MPSQIYHTSRTEIETWQKCKRAYYYRKVYGGRGIVPSFRAVPLVTGGSIHKGIEVLAGQVLAGQTPDVSAAIKAAKAHYAEQVADRTMEATLSDTQEFVKREQSALVAALIRVWHKIELPRLLAEYRIVQSEKSIGYRISGPDKPVLRFMSKADMILENLETGEPYIYSLKTAKMWTPRSEASYNTDLQGLTESMGVMQQRRELNQYLKEKKLAIKARYKAGEISREKALEEIATYPQPYIEQVMGVRFCFLIKGPRYDLFGPDGEKLGKWTDSPFLYGYKRQGPGDIEYAHSDKVYKPENKSGYGKLGKGWEKFSVFDGGPDSKNVGGIKGWIEMLASGEIQPELDNPLQMSVITPLPRFPHTVEIDSTARQVKAEAEAALLAQQKVEGKTGEELFVLLDEHFPQTRRNCYWPTDCDYLHACYRANPEQNLLDPMGSPYEAREPHHEVEKADWEEAEEKD